MMNQGANPAPNPADKAKEDALYEDREPKKIIRIITVVAYMVSVSFVGITLSAYYIFLWHPPNPRLMHAQAMDARRETDAEYLVQDEYRHRLIQHMENNTGFARLLSDPGLDPPGINVLDQLEPGSETLKIRREIVKNVNAIVRANFEKTRASEPPNVVRNDSVSINNTLSKDNVTESSASDSEVNKTNNSPSIKEESTTKSRTTTTVISTSVPPLKRTRTPGRKQHQTPFALKHLEVPIKSDGLKKRLARLTTTTMRSSTLSLNTKGW